MRAERTLTATTQVLNAGFAGSAALVREDGSVDEASFDAFADRVAAATGVRTVGYAPVVADDERAAYEARIGGSITEVGADGTLQPAADRAPPTRRSPGPTRSSRPPSRSSGSTCPPTPPVARRWPWRVTPAARPSPPPSLGSPTVWSRSSSSRRSTGPVRRWRPLPTGRPTSSATSPRRSRVTWWSRGCSTRPSRVPGSRWPTAPSSSPRRTRPRPAATRSRLPAVVGVG